MMALTHAILATLLDEPRSGYGLAKRFDRAVGYFWQATHQQIYRELAKMEGEGLVASVVVAQMGRPDKKLYTLTPLGREQLLRWMMQPVAAGPVREDLLVKLWAGTLVDMTVVLAELRQHRAQHVERHRLYHSLCERDFSNPDRLTRAEQFHYLPLLRGMMYEADNVAWCDLALDLLEAESTDVHPN